MASISVLSPERRIELNPFDTDAWNILIRETQARAIDQARIFYEKLVSQFPNCGKYWKIYIEHELRAKNFENVEALFERSLINVLNIDLWKCYLFYLKETKGHLPGFREKMAQAYDFALENVGLDVNAYSIYNDYITFLKTVPAVGQYAENQRISAIRKVFQRGVVTPMMHIDSLWNEYCSYERGINATLAEKLIADKNKDHQNARRVTRLMEQFTRGLNRSAVSVPPRGTGAELKQVELWRKYIHWEKSNPLNLEEYANFSKRVIYAYDQALLCLGYLPDIWYEAAHFQQLAAKNLKDKGDVKHAKDIFDGVVKLYEKALTGLMKDSQLLYFSYADYEEERNNFDAAKKIYHRLLDRKDVNPTLVYIQLMKFTRRTEGVKQARTIFKQAREDPRSSYHIFAAAALMEYYCSKDTAVAMRIFDLGLKKFGDDPNYCLAYTDFLSHLNEDNNTRVVFERILSKTDGKLAAENSIEIWDQYLDFESQVGDLASVLKVDSRRREAMKDQYEDKQAILLVDRYKFLNLSPCTSDQLKFMGYNKGSRQSSNTQNGVIGSVSSQPSTSNAKSLEIGGFPMPDTDQMLPFKPTASGIVTSHPVPGGAFPPPPAAAMLLQMLPPPWCFEGPFVNLDFLMDSLAKFNKEMPKSDIKDPPLDPNATFGGVKASEIRKEFYQTLSTTTDPAVVLAHPEYAQKKRRAWGEDDDDINGSGDIFKKRMNMRAEV
uniref:Suf domain-containing protein n=2 Tax=Bursaphelenchus xylophilus TaxID=6326 RepID=A0A1I7SWS6_BURXY